MSDWESIQAEARELAAEDRVQRINARRRSSVNSASLGPPEFICEDGCGLDGDCECSEEVQDDEWDEVVEGYTDGDQTKAVGPERPASGPRAVPVEAKPAIV